MTFHTTGARRAPRSPLPVALRAHIPVLSPTMTPCLTSPLVTRPFLAPVTVAVNRSYDLAFSGTNPENLRLFMPHGAGELRRDAQEANRVVLSIFYSNPEKLEVYYRRLFVKPLEHHMTASNSYNFSMRKPVFTDPCGSNAFAAWENKLYVVVWCAC